jgi:hypothetical protein
LKGEGDKGGEVQTKKVGIREWQGATVINILKRIFRHVKKSEKARTNSSLYKKASGAVVILNATSNATLPHPEQVLVQKLIDHLGLSRRFTKDATITTYYGGHMADIAEYLDTGIITNKFIDSVFTEAVQVADWREGITQDFKKDWYEGNIHLYPFKIFNISGVLVAKFEQ